MILKEFMTLKKKQTFLSSPELISLNVTATCQLHYRTLMKN